MYIRVINVQTIEFSLHVKRPLSLTLTLPTVKIRMTMQFLSHLPVYPLPQGITYRHTYMHT